MPPARGVARECRLIASRVVDQIPDGESGAEHGEAEFGQGDGLALEQRDQVRIGGWAGHVGGEWLMVDG
jgi:hypothetical protein